MEQVLTKIKQEYEQFGYNQLRVNLFEDFECYYQNREYINDQNILKVIHPSGRLYGLQADITISAAKIYSNNKQKLCKSQKYYYQSQTYSSIMAPNTGIKCSNIIGVEWFGAQDIYSDVEMLQLAYNSLSKFNYDFILEISLATILKDLIDKINLTKSQQHNVIELIATKNIDKLKEYFEQLNTDSKISFIVLKVSSLKGHFREVLKQLEKYLVNNCLQESYDYLKQLEQYLIQLKIIDDIYLDFSLSNQYNYYSGIIFQGFIKGVYQPVLRGGRYDCLKTNLNKDFNAIGFSIELDDLMTSHKKTATKISNLVLYDEPSEKITSILADFHNNGHQACALSYNQILIEDINKLSILYDNIYSYRGNKLVKEV